MAIVGDARVSTGGQGLAAVLDVLIAASAGRIFPEWISGSKRARPELDKLTGQLREGEVVTVAKHDRLSRSLQDLLAIGEMIQARGAGFRSLAEGIDATTSAGRLVFASIAQLHRERIPGRTREGLATARKAGRIDGRPPAPSRQRRDEEGRRIARLFDVSPNTVRRAR